jgi:hypothetical protein
MGGRAFVVVRAPQLDACGPQLDATRRSSSRLFARGHGWFAGNGDDGSRRFEHTGGPRSRAPARLGRWARPAQTAPGRRQPAARAPTPAGRQALLELDTARCGARVLAFVATCLGAAQGVCGEAGAAQAAGRLRPHSGTLLPTPPPTLTHPRKLQLDPRKSGPRGAALRVAARPGGLEREGERKPARPPARAPAGLAGRGGAAPVRGRLRRGGWLGQMVRAGPSARARARARVPCCGLPAPATVWCLAYTARPHRTSRVAGWRLLLG